MERREQHACNGAQALWPLSTASNAAFYCIAGCALGQASGMAIANSAGWGVLLSISFAVPLAFMLGYLLSLFPLLRAGLPLIRAADMVLAANTPALTVMEITATAALLILPGAMNTPLDSPWFWVSVAGTAAIGGLVAYPLSAWMLFRRMCDAPC